MDTQEFNKNDKVKLKSGGPIIMVIARFEIDEAGATCAVCGWSSIAKKQKTATIPVGMLEHAD